MGEIECTKCLYNINSKCEIGGWNIPKVGCQDGKAKPMSNADRIRSMTDEELAKWMSANATNYACHKFSEIGVIEKYGDNGLIAKSWLDWLKEEATDG